MIYINILIIVIITILVGYAAYCNAVMDTVSDFDDVHFIASIFSEKDPLWYNKNKSWVLKKDKNLWLQHLPSNLNWLKKLPFSDSISDNWHWSKTKMLFSLIISIPLALVSGILLYIVTQVILIIIGFFITFFIILSIAWIQTFNTYFNKKLKK